MPTLNFKQQFRPHIRSGRKKHTIRAKRKRPIKPRDKLYLYTGMRTKQCQKIMDATCVKVEEIVICLNRTPLGPSALETCGIFIEGIALNNDEKDRLAYMDGFDNFADMMKFWDGRLPFTGDIIYWR
jgi:hypothetical protein